MSKPARAPEPSMEEILASIRRIIADDSGQPVGQTPAPARTETAPVPARPAPPAPPSGAELEQKDVDALMDAPGDSDVLELTQAVEASPAFRTVRGPDVAFREEERREPEPPPSPPPPPPAPRQGPAMKEQELLSPSSSASIAAAFNSLATTVLTEHSRTLEDLVKEMMRPMLKQWLEDNLPGLVERLVRAEIERVARGGR